MVRKMGRKATKIGFCGEIGVWKLWSKRVLKSRAWSKGAVLTWTASWGKVIGQQARSVTLLRRLWLI